MRNGALVIGVIIVAVIAYFVAEQPSKKSIQMNNHRCPVTGNEVNDTDTYTYKGKEYKLCGKKCQKILTDNPDQYLKD